jgi:zinc transport system substrate-binding protein
MKKILFLLISANFLFAQINTIVSIAPQKYFVKKIGGDKVSVSAMVLPGNSPHTYEPKPTQMIAVSKADIYFSIGIEFEHAWLNKFQSTNKNMLIIDNTKDIKKIAMAEHKHGEEEHHSEEDGLDPHVWLSTSTAKVMAKNIYEGLIKVDMSNKNYYQANYENLLKEIDILKSKINDILLRTDDMAKFIVFHPSWGYFAKEFRLVQVAIEVGGKNPKGKHIRHIIKEAKKSYYEVIITAPEFNDSSAKLIAREAGVKVVKVSPLEEQWDKNLIKFAKAIAK